MIIPQFKGRLGNQLFQAATAFSLSKRVDDTIALEGNKDIHPIFDRFGRYIHSNQFELYTEPQFRYKEINIPNYNRNNVYLLDGYFQSLKYFEKDEEEFIKLLSFPEESKNKIESKIEGLKYIVIHARRGDYFFNQHIHPVQGTDYFLRGLKHFSDYKIIVCSDDIHGFDKENNGKFDYLLSRGSEFEDLLLMANADGLILSNSSFSWWGARFNHYKKNARVVCPVEWFGSASGIDYADIFCEGWIKE